MRIPLSFPSKISSDFTFVDVVLFPECFGQKRFFLQDLQMEHCHGKNRERHQNPVEGYQQQTCINAVKG